MHENLFKLFFTLTSIFFSTALFAESKATFKVGIIAPLSGAVAPMGEAFRDGFSLYLKDNPACTQKVDLIFEDGKYDGKTTVTAFHKLRAEDKVNLSIVWGNTPASVLAPIAESKKSPMLAVAYTPEAKGRSSVITFGPKTKTLSKKIAEEFKHWNLKRPAAIAVNAGNILEEIEYVNEMLGGTLYTQTVSTKEE